MTLVMLQYPLLPLLCAGATLLTLLAARSGRRWAALGGFALALTLLFAALFCAIPLTETLLMMILPLLACLAVLTKEDAP